MSREIEFRGKHKRSGKFVVGNLVKMVSGWCIQNPNNENEMHIVHRETVGQYTGLKDKNGVEIYEGDILQSHHFYDAEGKELKLSHIVQWSEKYSGWYALNVDSMDEGDGSQQLWAYMKNAIEPHVIGNIHENPELLEAK